MRHLTHALAAATILVSAPSLAGEKSHFEPSSFAELSDTFHAADIDHDGWISRSEYASLRMGTLNSVWMGSYDANQAGQMKLQIDKSFGALDTDGNGTLTQSEFINGVRNAMNAEQPEARYSYAWADPQYYWAPDYFTVTYYLGTNDVEATELKGDKVVNMKGEEIGAVEEIIKTDDDNRYYAMIDLKGDVIRTPTREGRPTDLVGIPLDNILFYDDDHALMLSSTGENYLRKVENPVIRDFEIVDRVEL